MSSHLFAYTGGKTTLEAQGRTLGAVLDDLDRRFPGLKFRVVDEQDRIRTHMRIYVDEAPAADMARRVGARAEIHILGALSGG